MDQTARRQHGDDMKEFKPPYMDIKIRAGLRVKEENLVLVADPQGDRYLLTAQLIQAILMTSRPSII